MGQKSIKKRIQQVVKESQEQQPPPHDPRWLPGCRCRFHKRGLCFVCGFRKFAAELDDEEDVFK